MTSIITSLGEFEQLLVIAKKHGLTQFSIGDIAVVMPLPLPEKEPISFTNESPLSADEIDAQIYRATLTA